MSVSSSTVRQDQDIDIHALSINHESDSKAQGYTLRPEIKRRDSEVIFSYYRSADADRNYNPLEHKLESSPSSRKTSSTTTSSDSTTPSDYSSDALIDSKDTCKNQRKEYVAHEGPRRRPSIPSEGGADRRRLAIIEIGASTRDEDRGISSAGSRTNSMAPSSRSESIRSRRGLEGRLGGFALVAPPDASPKTYTDLEVTPPSTAPIAQTQSVFSAAQALAAASHQRSASEAVSVPQKVFGHVHRKPSREVAVIGTISTPGQSTSEQQRHSQPSPISETLQRPIFLMPQDRAPSPAVSELSDFRSPVLSVPFGRVDPSPALSSPGLQQEVVTPGIGESKKIDTPVAGPVVVNLSTARSSSPSKAGTQPFAFPQSVNPQSQAASTPFMPIQPTSYLHYQPGIHATAGPLPPPPMSIVNLNPNTPPPPRPPRLHSPLRRPDIGAMKQSLQLPPSVSTALQSRSPSPSTSLKPTETELSQTVPSGSVKFSPPQETNSNPMVATPKDTQERTSNISSSHTDSDPRLKAMHMREGAGSPSTSHVSNSEKLSPSPQASPPLQICTESIDDLVAVVGDAIDDMGIINASDVPPPTIIEPPRHREGSTGRSGLDIRREDGRNTVSPDSSAGLTLTSDESASSHTADTSAMSPRSSSRSPSKLDQVEVESDAPSAYLRHSKTAIVNAKRFSALPRTPSLMSLKPFPPSAHSSRTSSPPVGKSNLRLAPVQKIRSAWPASMHFADVVAKKSALERSVGYANKINELYMHDCGLGDWLAEVKRRGVSPQSPRKQVPLNPLGFQSPSNNPRGHHHRQISQSSMTSEATFPKRADSYSATDLASPSGDSRIATAPPPLPYPALAAAPRLGPSRTSTITFSSSSSGRSSTSPPLAIRSPSTFFASLGRKTSLKKERGTILSPPSPAKSLPNNQSNSIPNLRPVNMPIPTAPSVPGGPRAPPHRMQRSQTIMVSPPPLSSGTGSHRSSTILRRPSLFTSRNSAEPAINVEADSEFARQIDRLADLLPNADKRVLAGYLRRAGQDILAIGQFLEDEKNGAIRHDL